MTIPIALTLWELFGIGCVILIFVLAAFLLRVGYTMRQFRRECEQAVQDWERWRRTCEGALEDQYLALLERQRENEQLRGEIRAYRHLMPGGTVRMRVGCHDVETDIVQVTAENGEIIRWLRSPFTIDGGAPIPEGDFREYVFQKLEGRNAAMRRDN